MILEMYIEKNYDNQDALVANSLTIGMNVVTLFVYFFGKLTWISFVFIEGKLFALFF